MVGVTIHTELGRLIEAVSLLTTHRTGACVYDITRALVDFLGSEDIDDQPNYEHLKFVLATKCGDPECGRG